MPCTNDLTIEQEALLSQLQQNWSERGLSCEPANRLEAELGVNMIYAGLRRLPPKIIWCGSPLGVRLMRSIICNHLIESELACFDKVVVAAITEDARSNSLRELVEKEESIEGTVETSVMGRMIRKLVKNKQYLRLSTDRKSKFVSVAIENIAKAVHESIEEAYIPSYNRGRQKMYEASRLGLLDLRGRSFELNWSLGQHDTFLAFQVSAAEVLGLPEISKALGGWIKVSENAGWFLPKTKVCWICDRTASVNHDEEGRIHALDRPAISFRDGWKIYAIQGTRVPEHVIEKSNDLTPISIENEKKAEIRRAMIYKFGYSRYLESAAEKLDWDDRYGTLYRKAFTDDRPIAAVQLVSGEFVRVPCDFRLVKQAVDWVANNRSKDEETWEEPFLD